MKLTFVLYKLNEQKNQHLYIQYIYKRKAVYTTFPPEAKRFSIFPAIYYSIRYKAHFINSKYIA